MSSKPEVISGAYARVARLTAELSTDDPQFRDARPLEAIGAVVHEPGLGLAQTVAAIMDGYAERPALGERATEVVTDPVSGRTSLRLLPRFETISYRELWARVQAVAAEWQQDGQAPLGAGDFVALIGFTSSDYATLELACMDLGAVAVPLQSGASLAQLASIIAETGPRVLAANIEYLDKAVELALSAAQAPRIIVFDYHPEVDDQREKFEAASRRLTEAADTAITSLAAVLDRGQALPPAPLFIPGADEDPLSLLIYTSGSTGTPKGAMLTGQLVRRLWAGFPRPPEVGEAAAAISINYTPMSHLAAHDSLWGTLGRGGIGYFISTSDLSTLLADIGLVRPTELALMPRICDMLFESYQSELRRRAADFDDEDALDVAVKTDLRERRLGGRMLGVGFGSAPLSADMAAFVESLLDLPLHEGYGSTEAGLILLDSQVVRPIVLDYKLVDVPELGYFRTDSPYPRGELLVKTEKIFPGYYQRPEATAAVFDENGYYKTGDIMAELAPDHLVYVDRRNNVLKLSQGEFVAVSRLETVFGTSPLIEQIFVYGSSERAYLLAVIVPTEEARKQAGNSAELKSLLSASLQQVAQQAGLNSYEVPRDFLIESEPFTVGNQLLSEVRKLLRPRLKVRYGDRLEQLYRELADGQAHQLRMLRDTAADLPVIETVNRAAQALLGSSSAALDATKHFTDLGGDSLSALSFSNLMQEIFDIEVPVGVIISPANDLQQIANYIQAERASGAKRPTFATVHGRHSTQVQARDLRLDTFIDADTIAAATTLPRPNGRTPRTVLLTGANGYLGRFLCLEWLERLDETGGTLIAIVRAGDAIEARARLDEAFDSGDAELLRHYQELAAEHLEVLAGDISEPNLGLDEQTWNRLADEVDLIVNPAALVNHILPYNQLFGPNVVGTAELIRLAITSKIKPFTHLSTLGVLAQTDPSVLDEDTDIRALSPARTLNDDYASGYGTSKWASEVLLREAHDACGLPVTVFRSDMILTHSHYTGQLNVPDVFTRLLFSLLTTGIAPRSFYRTDTTGNRPRAHYDGLPVDFTAEAIATLGAQDTDEYRTFHALNPYDDGISLDVFVDWLNEAGHPIQRIDDYQQWFARFDTTLRALPESQRQHSLLPLLASVQEPGEPIPGAGVPAGRFHAAVRDAKIGADKDIPHLSAPLIGKYVTDLQQLGLVP